MELKFFCFPMQSDSEVRRILVVSIRFATYTPSSLFLVFQRRLEPESPCIRISTLLHTSFDASCLPQQQYSLLADSFSACRAFIMLAVSRSHIDTEAFQSLRIDFFFSPKELQSASQIVVVAFELDMVVNVDRHRNPGGFAANFRRLTVARHSSGEQYSLPAVLQRDGVASVCRKSSPCVSDW